MGVNLGEHANAQLDSKHIVNRFEVLGIYSKEGQGQSRQTLEKYRLTGSQEVLSQSLGNMQMFFT